LKETNRKVKKETKIKLTIDLKSIVFGPRTFAIGTCFFRSALKILHLNM